MGAVYGEEISQKAEDGSDQNGRSGITSKPSTTQYPGKSHRVIVIVCYNMFRVQ
jgi:hypothetical protein